MLTNKEQQILDLLEPTAIAHDVEIVTVEISGAKKSPTIRIYLDTPHGVSFDDISNAQTWINEIVEKADPFPGAYVLEVSSPGIDRPLRLPQHFIRFVGSACVLKTIEPINGRQNFTGVIAEANDQSFTVEADKEHYVIAYENVKKAQVKGTVDFKRKEEN